MAVRLSTGAVNALAGGGAGDGSFKDIFANAVIVIRTGTQPATADAAETGDVLGMITVNGGAFYGWRNNQRTQLGRSRRWCLC